MAIPAIDTDRLTLRAHGLDDFRESAAMWADPVVTRHIGGRPSTEEEAWARLLRYAGHWTLLGFGFWAIREQATGRFVGEVGLADLKRELDPSFGGAPEVGWALATWAHGKGFATEAIRAAITWADAELVAPRTVCMINPENAASIRVAAKCGFREWSGATYKGEQVILFERPRSAHMGG